MVLRYPFDEHRYQKGKSSMKNGDRPVRPQFYIILTQIITRFDQKSLFSFFCWAPKHIYAVESTFLAEIINFPLYMNARTHTPPYMTRLICSDCLDFGMLFVGMVQNDDIISNLLF